MMKNVLERFRDHDSPGMPNVYIEACELTVITDSPRVWAMLDLFDATSSVSDGESSACGSITECG